jgi:hypothetical protein
MDGAIRGSSGGGQRRDNWSVAGSYDKRPAGSGNPIPTWVTAIEVAGRQQAISWRQRAATSLAELHTAQGRSDEAERVLSDGVTSGIIGKEGPIDLLLDR